MERDRRWERRSGACRVCMMQSYDWSSDSPSSCSAVVLILKACREAGNNGIVWVKQEARVCFILCTCTWKMSHYSITSVPSWFTANQIVKAGVSITPYCGSGVLLAFSTTGHYQIWCSRGGDGGLSLFISSFLPDETPGISLFPRYLILRCFKRFCPKPPCFLCGKLFGIILAAVP